ncbi:MAG: IS21 family transposase [Planctomycetota bacterium]|jgi:transposase|nr:IS21 family transposase [Planctomycetota bacterium]
MAKRIIQMYEYRNIIYRLKEKQSARAIARDGLASRTKVDEIKAIAKRQGWLLPEAKLPDDAALAQILEQKPASHQASKADVFADEIKSWVESGVQASTIHQYLMHRYQFSGSYNCIQRYVKKLKATMTPPKLTVPLHFKPGEAAQVDFGQGPVLYDKRVGCEVKTWFFVMTLCWSRHQYVEIITHQDIETWLNCHQNAFDWFGGVPSKIIIDNPKCAITRACYHDPEVQRSYEALAQDYHFLISACPPRDPQKKGRVEAGVKYVKKNFVPLRDLKSVQDANKQLKVWITGTAGNRTHGTTFKQPLTQFTDIEQYQLKPRPATPPAIATWQKSRLYRDCHIRYKQCKYSAPHTLYDEELWVKVTANTVSVYHQHHMVACHPRRFKSGESSTKNEHLPPEARAYFERDETWCLKQSQAVGSHCRLIIEDLLTDPVRDLLRQAQLILKLCDKYSGARLEKACERALKFNAGNYTTIKTILAEGIDYEQIDNETSFEQLSSVYQGQAQYQRHIDEVAH